MSILTPQPLNYDLLGPFMAVPGQRMLSAYSITTETVGYVEGTTNAVTLTGSPVVYTASGGGPYLSLDGSTQYASVAHGDYVEPLKQATIIILYYPTSAQNEDIVGSYAGGGQSKYKIAIDSSLNVVAAVTADGSTQKAATQASGYAANAWNMAALIFSPSTYVRSWANGSATSNTTSIGSGLHDTTGALYIGSASAAAGLTGYVGLVAIYATIVHDDHLSLLYAHALQFYR